METHEKVRLARKAAKWTQEQLASASSVASSTVSRIERGQPAELVTLQAFAKALGRPVSDLLGDDEKAPAPESRVEVEVLTSLLEFFARTEVSLEERAALVERSNQLVAGDGLPNWSEELGKLRVRPAKRVKEPDPEVPSVREGLQAFGSAKRPRR